MQHKFEVILFDIGGVLIEYGDVFKTVAKEQNFAHELIDNTFDKYDTEITTGKITPQELYLKCIAENNLDANKDYNFTKSWINDYEIIKPTFELLIELKNKYKVGYLSNIYKGMVEEMINQNVIPHVEEKLRFLSCNIGFQKPDIELYKYVQENLAIAPSDILFIDDKSENFPPADKIGWYTFEFERQSPKGSVARLRKLLL